MQPRRLHRASTPRRMRGMSGVVAHDLRETVVRSTARTRFRCQVGEGGPGVERWWSYGDTAHSLFPSLTAEAKEMGPLLMEEPRTGGPHQHEACGSARKPLHAGTSGTVVNRKRTSRCSKQRQEV